MNKPADELQGRSAATAPPRLAELEAPPLTAAHQGPPTDPPSVSFTTAVLHWQATADPLALERLVRSALPLIERMAQALLRSHGIVDPSAVDEAVSLVLDHLRRLPGAVVEDRLVARFDPRVSAAAAPHGSDAGRAYLLWLSRERARDVARARRRQCRHAVPFSLLDRPTIHRVHDVAERGRDDDPEPASDLHDRLLGAIGRLPERERAVVELLLAGHTQAVIARTLSICEGTVSRLRTRAVDTLRHLLAE